MKPEIQEAICSLMDKLKDAMEYNEDDLSERLGRKKPEVEVVKMEGEMPMDGDDVAMDGLDEESEEDSLKKRLMKMRA